MTTENDFYPIIKEFIGTGKIISIYANKQDENLATVGIMEKVTAHEYILQRIDTHGMYSGFIVREIENIFRIESDGKYEEKIRKLVQYKKSTPKEIPFSVLESAFIESVTHCMQSNASILIGVKNRDALISGFVTDIKKNLVSVESIDYDGTSDGVVIVSMKDIDYIEFDSPTCADIDILARH